LKILSRKCVIFLNGGGEWFIGSGWMDASGNRGYSAVDPSLWNGLSLTLRLFPKIVSNSSAHL